MLERRQGFESLENMLSSQLDPIDWATYEPYLWSNEATFYQRAGTLFGILLQTHRLHSQVTASTGMRRTCLLPEPAFATNAFAVGKQARKGSKVVHFRRTSLRTTTEQNVAVTVLLCCLLMLPQAGSRSQLRLQALSLVHDTPTLT